MSAATVSRLDEVGAALLGAASHLLASEGPGAISESLTDGTTDIGPAPRVDPPSLVRASLVVPNEPERGSKLDTGRVYDRDLPVLIPAANALIDALQRRIQQR